MSDESLPPVKQNPNSVAWRSKDWQETDPRGVPLGIVGSGDDEDGNQIVTFEDADGIMFTVPREWVKHDVEGATDGTVVPHSIIDAPPGQLEEIWRDAARRDHMRLVKEQKGAAWDGNADARDIWSSLDSWENLISEGKATEGQRQIQGSLRPSMAPPQAGVPTSASSGTGWRPGRRPPAPASIRRKEDIPPEAGSGLGNWNDVWDPKMQNWRRGAIK